MTPAAFKTIRTSAKLTQSVLASRLGYKGRDIVARYEAGRSPIPFLVQEFMLNLASRGFAKTREIVE